MRFANRTKVPVRQSVSELEKTIYRYGAKGFIYGKEEEGDKESAMIQFKMGNKIVRFVLELPASEQERRQRFRALNLVVKAKLEAVESKIASFEEEFMAHILLSDGRTVGEVVLPEIEEVYKLGKTPKRLLLGSFDDPS